MISPSVLNHFVKGMVLDALTLEQREPFRAKFVIRRKKIIMQIG